MPKWKLEDAKDQFSRLVRRAMAGEPQRVTRRGRDAVVVISAEEYDRLTRPAVGIVEFLSQRSIWRTSRRRFARSERAAG
jgi:prevent-host-death family protein